MKDVTSLRIKIAEVLSKYDGQLRVRGTEIEQDFLNFLKSNLNLPAKEASNLLGIKEHQWCTWRARIKRKNKRPVLKEVKIKAESSSKCHVLMRLPAGVSVEIFELNSAKQIIKSLC